MGPFSYVYPRAPGEPNTPLFPDEQVIEAAAEMSSSFLQKIFSDAAIHIRVIDKDVLANWRRQWSRMIIYDLPSSFKNVKQDGGFGYALYHDATLCGFSLNTLVRTHDLSDKTNGHIDAQIDYINKGPLKTPLRGYVLSCLADTLATYAHLQGADRAVISTILSASVKRQYPHMGFHGGNITSGNDAWLDIAGGERVIGPGF